MSRAGMGLKLMGIGVTANTAVLRSAKTNLQGHLKAGNIELAAQQVLNSALVYFDRSVPYSPKDQGFMLSPVRARRVASQMERSPIIRSLVKHGNTRDVAKVIIELHKISGESNYKKYILGSVMEAVLKAFPNQDRYDAYFRDLKAMVSLEEGAWDKLQGVHVGFRLYASGLGTPS
ncbi:hypothetical protein ACFLZ2_04575 [Candidatus Margulisiibacteriota bacterium]